MDNNNTATIEIPVSEYTELVRAKLGIDTDTPEEKARYSEYR